MLHTESMRTTFRLDKEACEIASLHADGEGQRLGKLVRKGREADLATSVDRSSFLRAPTDCVSLL